MLPASESWIGSTLLCIARPPRFCLPVIGKDRIHLGKRFCPDNRLPQLRRFHAGVEWLLRQFEAAVSQLRD
jgi:hypothetical protein